MIRKFNNPAMILVIQMKAKVLNKKLRIYRLINKEIKLWILRNKMIFKKKAIKPMRIQMNLIMNNF